MPSDDVGSCKLGKCTPFPFSLVVHSVEPVMPLATNMDCVGILALGLSTVPAVAITPLQTSEQKNRHKKVVIALNPLYYTLYAHMHSAVKAKTDRYIPY